MHDWSIVHSDPSAFLAGRCRHELLRSVPGSGRGAGGEAVLHAGFPLRRSGNAEFTQFKDLDLAQIQVLTSDAS